MRAAGNCPELTAAAQASALSLGAAHTFVALLQAGLPPSKWLSVVRSLPQVHRVMCATAEPVVHVVVAADDGHGRKVGGPCVWKNMGDWCVLVLLLSQNGHVAVMSCWCCSGTGLGVAWDQRVNDVQ